jgi:hypothetical protein
MTVVQFWGLHDASRAFLFGRAAVVAIDAKQLTPHRDLVITFNEF